MAYYAPGVTGKQQYVDTSQPVWGGTAKPYPSFSGLGCAGNPISQAAGGLGMLRGGGWPMGVPAGTQSFGQRRGSRGARSLLGLFGLGEASDFYMPAGTKALDGTTGAGLALSLAGKKIPTALADAGGFCASSAMDFPADGVPTADANSVVEAWASSGFFVVLFQASNRCSGGGDFLARVRAQDLKSAGIYDAKAYIYRFPNGGGPTQGFWAQYEPIAFGTSPPTGGAPVVVPAKASCPSGSTLDPVAGLFCLPDGGGSSFPPVKMCPDGSVSPDGQCTVLAPPDSGAGLSYGAKVVVVALIAGGLYLAFKG